MTDGRSIVGGACGLLLLGAALSVPSCADVPTSAQCEAACSVASRCRLLPSALGGAVGASRQHDEQDCVARCEASDAGAPHVLGLLERLGTAEIPQAEPLCSVEGTDACERLIEELEGDPDTSELEVTTTLIVRMTSAASHVTNRALSSWCCFDYLHELVDDGQASDDVDEVGEIHGMIQPTYDCATQLSAFADAAVAALEQMSPDLVEAAAQCECIRARWAEPPEETPEPPPEGESICEIDETTFDLADDDCRFARSSSRMLALDPPSVVCELDPLKELSKELADTIHEWKLDPGGWLIEPTEDPAVVTGSTARDVDAIRERLSQEIHIELTRPRGFLEESCADLHQELGADCEGLDRAAPPEASTCDAGPTCSATDCLEDEPACDETACDADRSPPGRECGALGVTEVRLGYRTAQGLEILGEPITGCETLAEVATTFAGVKVGPLVPIAIVSGVLPSSYVPDHATVVGDGSFSWIVEGDLRWVAAGQAVLELPSPMLEHLENRIEDPLEELGWIPVRLPTGQACDTQPDQCEGYFNDNCDNGLDDDGDGLVDDASPWCDGLMQELEQRCVVRAPGQAPFPGCAGP